MKLLIVGAGKGSWAIRGVQLGAALGARVTSAPTGDDFDWAEIIVLVKRAGLLYAHEAQQRHLPIVWDALDFWHQPRENGANDALANALLRRQIDVIRPALTIGATEAMARAAEGVCLPHHAWAGLVPTAPREHVRVVAYEGNPIYLGKWRGLLENECRARGWAFVVNPPDLSQSDVLVAFRDGEWDGWICREWKSGVKVVNAIAAGRPLIGQHSAARRELQPFGLTVESPAYLAAALDTCEDYDVRRQAYEAGLAKAPRYTLAAIAESYRTLLQSKGVAWAA